MNYKEAVKHFGKEEIGLDLRIWWEKRSDEQKYEMMSDYARKKAGEKKEVGK